MAPEKLPPADLPARSRCAPRAHNALRGLASAEAGDLDTLARYWARHYQIANDPRKIMGRQQNYRRWVDGEV